MHVVCLHPDNLESGPFIDTVPDMTAEVLRMLEAHRSASWQETVGGSSPADFAADRAQASQSELTPSRDFFDAGVVQHSAWRTSRKEML